MYKPIMDRTCCPQYTIRCKVDEFKPSKSQKKVLRRFRNYVINGKDKTVAMDISDKTETAVIEGRDVMEGAAGKKKLKQNDVVMIGAKKETLESKSDKVKKTDVSGETGSSSRPEGQKKAKEIRREKAALRAEKSPAVQKPVSNKNVEKTLEDYLEEPFPDDSVHKFEIKTVLAQHSNAEFESTFPEITKLYQKYQVIIHKDKESHCTGNQFTRFLCDASLKPQKEGRNDDIAFPGFGGFHQHYIIDGKVIAVGVVDFLPSCLSSVYLFYDPEYSFLTLGTLSTLFEIGLVKKLSRLVPGFDYYYMGFYIHSCPKMRYKAQYTGSYLLCPETYQWIEMESCIPKLNENKYTRLSSSDQVVRKYEIGSLNSLLILHERQGMVFELYKSIRNCEESGERSMQEDNEEVIEYANLVGLDLGQKMLLYRS